MITLRAPRGAPTTWERPQVRADVGGELVLPPVVVAGVPAGSLLTACSHLGTLSQGAPGGIRTCAINGVLVLEHEFDRWMLKPR